MTLSRDKSARVENMDGENNDCNGEIKSADNKSRLTNNENKGVMAMEDKISDDSYKSVSLLNDDIEDTEDLPVDKGWAWFVLAGCFLNIVLLMGYFKSQSILFVEYLQLFEASAAATTLFMGVSVGVLSITSVFVMHVILVRYGARKTVMLGGAVATVAMVAGVFAPNLTTLICVHCVLAGAGLSAIQGPGLVLLGRYFDKRRGLATSINMSGISLAAAVFPLITRLLVDAYGIRGTMLIFAGLMMNMFVGASLFRPFDSFQRKPKTFGDSQRKVVKEDPEKKANFLDTGQKPPDLDKVIEDKQNPLAERLDKILHDKEGHRSLPVHSTIHQLRQDDGMPMQFGSHKELSTSLLVPESEFRQRTYSHGSRPRVETIQDTDKMVYASNPDLIAVSLQDLTKIEQNKHIDEVKEQQECSCCCSILDFSLFRKPMFQLLIVCCFFGILLNIVSAYLPAFAGEQGVDKTKSALLLLIMGGLDFFSRLAFGAFVDTKILKVNQVMAIGLAIGGILTQFTFFYTTYPLLVMFAVLNGLVGSSYHCLVPMLVVDLMGLDDMGKSLGFVYLFHAFSMACAHPILGSIKDATGTYSFSFSYVGCMAITASLLLFFGEPIMRRRTQHKELHVSLDIDVKRPLKTP